MLKGKHLILGFTVSIAAYKAAYLPIGDVTFDESATIKYGSVGERNLKME